MVRIKEESTSFKIYYENYLFLQHSENLPLIKVGIGNVSYKMSHGKFAISEDLIIKELTLKNFKLLSVEENEIKLNLSNEDISLDLTISHQKNF